MSTLFEQFNQRLAEPEPQKDVQAQVQKVLGAGSGKAGGASTTPAASTLGQQAAQSQVQEAQQQQRLQGAITGAQLKSQEQQQAARVKAETSKQDLLDDMAAQDRVVKETLALQQIAGAEQLATDKMSAERRMTINAMNNAARQKLAVLASDREATIEDLWSTFQRSEKDLGLRRDGAQIEQLGFIMALQDEQYTAELDRIGKRRMLEDEVQFEQEMLNTRLGNSMYSFMENMDFLEAFNADRRTYLDQLSKIDVNFAIKMAQAALDEENSAKAWQGGINVVTSGADAYLDYEDKKAKEAK